MNLNSDKLDVRRLTLNAKPGTTRLSVRRLASDVQPFNLLRILCLTSLLALSLPTHASDSDTEAKLEQLKSRISQLEQWLGQAQGKRSSAEQALRKTELAIGKVAKNIRQVGNNIKQGQRQLRQLTDQEQALHGQLKQQADFLGQQIRAAYSIGRQEYLKVLLNQEQPAQLARIMTYYDYFQPRPHRPDRAVPSHSGRATANPPSHPDPTTAAGSIPRQPGAAAATAHR